MNKLLEWQKTQHLLPPVAPSNPLQDINSTRDPTMAPYHNGYDQNQQRQYQRDSDYSQPWQSQTNGIRDIGTTFSLRSVRQSLEQGVERLSSNGTIDSLKNRLVTEWNGLTAQQRQQSQTTTIPLNASSAGFYREHEPVLFSNSSGMIPQQQHVQQSQQIPPPGAVQSAGLTQVQSQQLSHRLGNSVAILQEFTMKVAREASHQQQSQGSLQTPQEAKVPAAVWEALAELEGIRVFLQQSNIS